MEFEKVWLLHLRECNHDGCREMKWGGVTKSKNKKFEDYKCNYSFLILGVCVCVYYYFFLFLKVKLMDLDGKGYFKQEVSTI